MASNYRRTLVTCALPYANGPVHIGHLAGVYVPADIFVRYLRMRGEDALFICGSDEHGVPITIKAKKQGVSPQEIVDKYHNIIKKSFAGLGINFDIYSRTSSKIHEKNASEFFRKLYDEGKFIVKETEQFYDEESKTFLADRYITGTCPKCGNENAYGDQCEKCGSTLSPEELINPRSALSGGELKKKKTKHWYLPLDQYEDWLREWILDGHKEWKSNVYGQCKSWLDSHLQPRAVSRDLDWGVPVPVDGAEGKVLYVWFDAPIGYVSNTMELLPKTWEKWWKDKETKLVNFIGKHNIVFHCIVFPSMLKAYGEYILPDNVPANEFLNLEGDKISTSRNWAVWLDEYLEDFKGQEDALRYTLCANAPESKDNDFTWKEFQQRNNNELVAIFGNFVNRAVVLTGKYFGGVVPENLKPEALDGETLGQIEVLKKEIEENIERYHFREALKSAMDLARLGNKYISDTEPWKTAKTDMDRTASTLYTSLQICAALSAVFEPFLPFSAERLRKILNVKVFAGHDHRNGDAEASDKLNFFKAGEAAALHTASLVGDFPAGEDFSVRKEFSAREKAAEKGYFSEKEEKNMSGNGSEILLYWEDLSERELLPSGHRLGQAELLFNKIEDEVVEAQIRKLKESKAANTLNAGTAESPDTQTLAPAKSECVFEDFEKLDIRTATVLEAERVPKTDKLLKLTIDTGLDKRTIVSGIAACYAPEDMIGRQICVLANLKPRVIRGIESKGMILMASEPDGKMRFITPEEVLSNGATIG